MEGSDAAAFGLERHFFVGQVCRVLVAPGWSLRPVSVALRIEELNPVGTDEIPTVLGTCLFVVPRLRAPPALHINAGAFAKVFAGDLCQAIQGVHGEPFRMFLQFAVFVFPLFSRGHGKLRDGRSLLAVIPSGSRPR